MAASLHQTSLVIDGLIISDFGRPVFEDMRKGGLTAANCTCSVWEGFTETMRNVMRWKAWFKENSDIITQVYTTADILKAKQEGKTGIILGWQNITGIEDQIGYLGLFKELGVGIIQMAYNTQNLVGTGCYETRDGGLSDFGREVVAEMQRLGLLVDLSHVAVSTMNDALDVAQSPVIFSHSSTRALTDNPRNVPDDVLARLAVNGGVCMVAFVPFFVSQECTDWFNGLKAFAAGRGLDPDNLSALFGLVPDWQKGNPMPPATISQVADHIDHVREVAGVAHVGIGADFDGSPFFPVGLNDVSRYPALFHELQRRHWSESDLKALAGANILRTLRDAGSYASA